MTRHVTDEERRNRLARRHALSAEHRVGTAVQATRAVGVLHATEPPTVYLSLAARADLSIEQIETALYRDRELVRQLAMRRTLFVFPRDLLTAAWGSAARRTLGGERTKLLKDLAADPSVPEPEEWLARQRAGVLGLLADGVPRSATEIRTALPDLDLRINPAPTATWARPNPIGPRVLTWLGAGGELMRGENQGPWRTSRPAWTLTEHWLGPTPSPTQALSSADGYAELVRVWLSRFGPGTEADIAWWLGATKSATRAALDAVGAVAVSLDGAATGWLLPEDLEPESDVEPWAALLPVLDPTTMGWKERDFYLDPALRTEIFDTNGNAGTTAWVDGRVVGCWVQDDQGRVEVRTRNGVTAKERSLLDIQAGRLTQWLAGERISSVYKSPMMKG